MASNSNRGIRRIFSAAGYSLQGLKAALFHEAAFRQEVFLASVLIVLALCLDVTAVERLLLMGSVWIVLIVELINSAIEAVVDRTGLERHPLSGRAKDLGSAAVFLALLQVAVCWGIILWS
ncbi:MAG: diacylglycerol kinase [Thermodesulfobacteriota bacterium]